MAGNTFLSKLNLNSPAHHWHSSQILWKIPSLPTELILSTLPVPEPGFSLWILMWLQLSFGFRDIRLFCLLMVWLLVHLKCWLMGPLYFFFFLICTFEISYCSLDSHCSLLLFLLCTRYKFYHTHCHSITYQPAWQSFPNERTQFRTQLLCPIIP